MGLHDGHRQRMKERFARHGLDSFAEHEVLELLLYYAIPRRDTNELAHTLLDRFGSLERVLLAPREELMKVPGVGEGAALLLTLVPAVSQYTHRHAPQETILNSVDASGRYFMRLLRHERRELLYQACLDGKGKLLSCRCLSEGGVNMAAVTLRLFRFPLGKEQSPFPNGILAALRVYVPKKRRTLRAAAMKPVRSAVRAAGTVSGTFSVVAPAAMALE